MLPGSEAERFARRRQNERLALCHRCAEAGASAICERQFPHGKCYTGWLAWVRAAASVCPLGKWGRRETTEHTESAEKKSEV